MAYDAHFSVLAVVITNNPDTKQHVAAAIAAHHLELTDDLAQATIAFCDLELPDAAQSALFAAAREAEVSVLAITSTATIETTVKAMQRGAADVLLMPLTQVAVRNAVTRLRIEASNSPSTATIEAEHGLIGESKAMLRLEEQIARAAKAQSTVLVRGESGTGKELVARAVHMESARANGPFVKVHCAALPEQLLESELFGYEKGAFTGAAANKPGRLEVADGGSLFLDEIGDISAATQVKLLRLLQDREYERLGSNLTHRADVRVITATHRDLETMIREGVFREDLFYRLNVVVLWVPPLRHRRGDIELLAAAFCARFAQANDRSVSIDSSALKRLRKERWPGNVRELQNVVERLVVLGDAAIISAAEVERELSGSAPFTTEAGESIIASRGSLEVVPLGEQMGAAEKQAIERALEHTGGDKKLAARLLGISRSTLYAKLSEHGIS